MSGAPPVYFEAAAVIVALPGFFPQIPFGGLCFPFWLGVFSPGLAWGEWGRGGGGAPPGGPPPGEKIPFPTLFFFFYLVTP